MKQKQEDSSEIHQDPGNVTWGPKLFVAAIVLVLAFFYWLLIYAGGVTVHHG